MGRTCILDTADIKILVSPSLEIKYIDGEAGSIGCVVFTRVILAVLRYVELDHTGIYLFWSICLVRSAAMLGSF